MTLQGLIIKAYYLLHVEIAKKTFQEITYSENLTFMLIFVYSFDCIFVLKQRIPGLLNSPCTLMLVVAGPALSTSGGPGCCPDSGSGGVRAMPVMWPELCSNPANMYDANMLSCLRMVLLHIMIAACDHLLYVLFRCQLKMIKFF